MGIMNYNDKIIYGTRDDVSLLLLQVDFRYECLLFDCQGEACIS